jgi:ribosomal protein S16
LSVGAQPSDTVRDIIKRAGVQVQAVTEESAAPAEAVATA